MSFNYSFWEKETFLKKADCIIVGGGLVGLNAAITMKQERPASNVLLVERGRIPQGASSRNAGFACFGSITELLSDLESSTGHEVLALLVRRNSGLNFLRSRVGDSSLNYRAVGGYEVFDTHEDVKKQYHEALRFLNEKISVVAGLKETFSFSEKNHGFKGLNRISILNQHEGSIHPGKMMQQLYSLAASLGIRFLMNTEVVEMEDDATGVTLHCNGLQLKSRSVILCTNGFTKSLIPEIELTPARNQVLLTEEIHDLKLDSCFHYDEGYVYFRNVGQRLLIGGARNIDLKKEETSQFGISDNIKEHLLDILALKIGLHKGIRIEHEWSGILGVGSVKSPILKKHSDNIIFAVRLGGMGVALGAKLGDEAAKLLLNDNT